MMEETKWKIAELVQQLGLHGESTTHYTCHVQGELEYWAEWTFFDDNGEQVSPVEPTWDKKALATELTDDDEALSWLSKMAIEAIAKEKGLRTSAIVPDDGTDRLWWFGGADFVIVSPRAGLNDQAAIAWLKAENNKVKP